MNKTPNINQPNNSSRSMWTLSWRLKGLSLGMALAALYCYFYLQIWDKWLLLAGMVGGYFLGWIAGLFSYRER